MKNRNLSPLINNSSWREDDVAWNSNILFAARLPNKNSETFYELQAWKLVITWKQTLLRRQADMRPFLFIFLFYFHGGKDILKLFLLGKIRSSSNPRPWIAVTSCWTEHSGRMSNEFFLLNLWQVVGKFCILYPNVCEWKRKHPTRPPSPNSKFFQGNLQVAPCQPGSPRAAAVRPSVIVQKRRVLLEQSRSSSEEEACCLCGIHTGCLLGWAWRLLGSVWRK